MAKKERIAPFNIPPEKFKELGYALVDRIADMYKDLNTMPVNPDTTPEKLQTLLPERLPEDGSDPQLLLENIHKTLLSNSLFNGHPSFFGYITSSPAPIGTLSDFLASSVNPNVGIWNISPIASEIERQTLQWIASFLRYPEDCGGVLVSGGNIANMVGFWAARFAKSDWDIQKEGFNSPNAKKFTAYVSADAHTWVEKAADLSGIGTAQVRWVPTDTNHRMDIKALRNMLDHDLSSGFTPLIIVATAGTVGTGTVDPVVELSAVSNEYGTWFHIDGAYGAPAAACSGLIEDIYHLSLADSIAVDPHKWLYSPIEAGAVLVKDRETLRKTFSYVPNYYFGKDSADKAPINYFEYGPQNTRGFRALKVWAGFMQAGRKGMVQMIEDDIRLSAYLANEVKQREDFELISQSLSITTFRFLPAHLQNTPENQEAINEINRNLLQALQKSGKGYPTHAIVKGRFAIRACIVNFRTTEQELDQLLENIKHFGLSASAKARE